MTAQYSMKCPTCEKEIEFAGNPYRPFCSERCKLIDLGNWAGERYRVPTQEKPSDNFENDDQTSHRD